MIAQEIQTHAQLGVREQPLHRQGDLRRIERIGQLEADEAALGVYGVLDRHRLAPPSCACAGPVFHRTRMCAREVWVPDRS